MNQLIASRTYRLLASYGRHYPSTRFQRTASEVGLAGTRALVLLSLASLIALLAVVSIQVASLT